MASVRFRHYKKDELAIGKRFVAWLADKRPKKITTDVRLYPSPKDTERYLAEVEARVARQFGMVGSQPALSDEEKKMLLDERALRIDMVVEFTFVVWIVEIKDEPRPSAVGQLVTYEVLYRRQFREWRPTKKVLVCEGSNVIVEEVCRKQGIDVIRV